MTAKNDKATKATVTYTVRAAYLRDGWAVEIVRDNSAVAYPIRGRKSKKKAEKYILAICYALETGVHEGRDATLEKVVIIARGYS